MHQQPGRGNKKGTGNGKSFSGPMSNRGNGNMIPSLMSLDFHAPRPYGPRLQHNTPFSGVPQRPPFQFGGNGSRPALLQAPPRQSTPLHGAMQSDEFRPFNGSRHHPYPQRSAQHRGSNWPPSGPWNAPRPNNPFNVPPPRGPFQAPPRNGPFHVAPPSSQSNVLPTSGQWNTPPPTGPFNAPQQSGQRNMPQQSGPYNVPPANNPFSAPPRQGPFHVPPPNGSIIATPPNNSFNVPPPSGPCSTAPLQKASNVVLPPQNGTFDFPLVDEADNKKPPASGKPDTMMMKTEQEKPRSVPPLSVDEIVGKLYSEKKAPTKAGSQQQPKQEHKSERGWYPPRDAPWGCEAGGLSNAKKQKRPCGDLIKGIAFPPNCSRLQLADYIKSLNLTKPQNANVDQYNTKPESRDVTDASTEQNKQKHPLRKAIEGESFKVLQAAKPLGPDTKPFQPKDLNVSPAVKAIMEAAKLSVDSRKQKRKISEVSESNIDQQKKRPKISNVTEPGLQAKGKQADPTLKIISLENIPAKALQPKITPACSPALQAVLLEKTPAKPLQAKCEEATQAVEEIPLEKVPEIKLVSVQYAKPRDPRLWGRDFTTSFKSPFGPFKLKSKPAQNIK